MAKKKKSDDFGDDRHVVDMRFERDESRKQLADMRVERDESRKQMEQERQRHHQEREEWFEELKLLRGRGGGSARRSYGEERSEY
jgi:hypothetical protein